MAKDKCVRGFPHLWPREIPPTHGYAVQECGRCGGHRWVTSGVRNTTPSVATIEAVRAKLTELERAEAPARRTAMIRVIFEYEGLKPNAPRITIDAPTEDEAIDQFCEMQRKQLRRFAQKDWVYESVRVRKQRKPAGLTAR